MDSFGKIVEILVTTVLLFFIPVYYISLRQDAVCQSQVRTETAYFVDSVRNQGYLTRNMYELFLKELDRTGQVYDVKLTYYKKIRTENEEGEYEVHYEAMYSEELLSEERIRKQGILHAETVRSIWNSFIMCGAYADLVWNLVTLQMWMENI